MWNQTKNSYLPTLFVLIWFAIQKRRGKIQKGENHVHQGLSKVFVFYTYSSHSNKLCFIKVCSKVVLNLKLYSFLPCQCEKNNPYFRNQFPPLNFLLLRILFCSNSSIYEVRNCLFTQIKHLKINSCHKHISATLYFDCFLLAIQKWIDVSQWQTWFFFNLAPIVNGI